MAGPASLQPQDDETPQAALPGQSHSVNAGATANVSNLENSSIQNSLPVSQEDVHTEGQRETISLQDGLRSESEAMARAERYVARLWRNRMEGGILQPVSRRRPGIIIREESQVETVAQRPVEQKDLPTPTVQRRILQPRSRLRPETSNTQESQVGVVAQHHVEPSDLPTLTQQDERDQTSRQGSHTAFHGSHTALQVPHTTLQRPHTVLEEPHTALQESHAALQGPHSALQAPHTSFQGSHTAHQGSSAAFNRTAEPTRSSGASPTVGSAWTPCPVFALRPSSRQEATPEEKVQKLLKECDELRKGEDSQAEAMKQMEQVNATLRLTNEKLDEQIRYGEMFQEELQQKHAAQTEELEKIKKQNHSLRKGRDESNEKNHELERSLADAQKERDRLNKTVARHEETIRGQKHLLDIAEAEAADTDRVADLSAANLRLEAELEEAKRAATPAPSPPQIDPERTRLLARLLTATKTTEDDAMEWIKDVQKICPTIGFDELESPRLARRRLLDLMSAASKETEDEYAEWLEDVRAAWDEGGANAEPHDEEQQPDESTSNRSSDSPRPMALDLELSRAYELDLDDSANALIASEPTETTYAPHERPASDFDASTDALVVYEQTETIDGPHEWPDRPFDSVSAFSGTSPGALAAFGPTESIFAPHERPDGDVALSDTFPNPLVVSESTESIFAPHGRPYLPPHGTLLSPASTASSMIGPDNLAGSLRFHFQSFAATRDGRVWNQDFSTHMRIHPQPGHLSIRDRDDLQHGRGIDRIEDEDDQQRSSASSTSSDSIFEEPISRPQHWRNHSRPGDLLIRDRDDLRDGRIINQIEDEDDRQTSSASSTSSGSIFEEIIPQPQDWALLRFGEVWQPQQYQPFGHLQLGHMQVNSEHERAMVTQRNNGGVWTVQLLPFKNWVWRDIITCIGCIMLLSSAWAQRQFWFDGNDDEDRNVIVRASRGYTSVHPIFEKLGYQLVEWIGGHDLIHKVYGV